MFFFFYVSCPFRTLANMSLQNFLYFVGLNNLFFLFTSLPFTQVHQVGYTLFPSVSLSICPVHIKFPKPSFHIIFHRNCNCFFLMTNPLYSQYPYVQSYLYCFQCLHCLRGDFSAYTAI